VWPDKKTRLDNSEPTDDRQRPSTAPASLTDNQASVATDPSTTAYQSVASVFSASGRGVDQQPTSRFSLLSPLGEIRRRNKDGTVIDHNALGVKGSALFCGHLDGCADRKRAGEKADRSAIASRGTCWQAPDKFAGWGRITRYARNVEKHPDAKVLAC